MQQDLFSQPPSLVDEEYVSVVDTGYSECERCGERSVIFDSFTNTRVCESCGNVSEEYVVQEEAPASSSSAPKGPSGSFPRLSAEVQRATGVRTEPKVVAFHRVPELLRTLKIQDKSILEQIQHLLEQASQTTLRHCRSDLLAAACIYVVLRRHAKPVTLAELADSLSPPATVSALGRLYNNLLRTLRLPRDESDPHLFLDRYCRELGLSPAQEKLARQFAEKLLKAASAAWLHTGRHHQPVAAAALLFASEVHGLGLSLQTVASRLSLSAHTISRRLNELKDIVVALAKNTRPPLELNRRNVTLHARAVFERSDALPAAAAAAAAVPFAAADAACIPSLEPPSFRASRAESERRRQKLERAKQRLSKFFRANPDVALATPLVPKPEAIKTEESGTLEMIDEEDLELMKLLLERVPEEQIIDGSYRVHREAARRVTGGEGEELDERDIPEEELAKFIRSEAEVKLLMKHSLASEPAESARSPRLKGDESSNTAEL